MKHIKHLLSIAFLCLLPLSVAHATKITVNNNDGASEGFNDPTVVAPTATNPGTTLGQQRLNAFQAAADYWERVLQSTVEILVDAELNSLSCSPTSGTLGSAGANNFTRDFAGTPRAGTWFAIAEVNSIIAVDADPVNADIDAQFNSDIGTAGCLTGLAWDYQIGVTAPPGTISFYETVLHEIGHGLGFLTLVDSTGFKPAGFDDIYMTFLRDESAGLNWPTMTNAQRAASAIDDSDLTWTGALAVAEAAALTAGRHASGNPQMFAPNPYDGGSSVSHWDTALEIGVNDELMEPSATANPIFDSHTIAAFYDMHWGDPCRVTKTLVANQWAQISLPCEPPAGANTVADILGDDMTGTYGTDWIVWDYTAAGGYTNLGSAGVMVPGKGYWVNNVTAGATLDMPAKSKKVVVVNSTQCAGLASNDNGCFEQTTAASATTPHWQMLGSPHRDNFNWSDMRVNVGVGASTCNDANGCTMAEAQTANLVNNQGWSYNAATTSYDTLLGNTVTPWTGFWFATLSGATAANPPTVLSPAK